MIIKTEAVVLKTMKYGETSKIVTLYTRRYGKMSAIARGARSLKTSFGSSLQPMNYVSVVLYRKDGRDLQYLTQGDVVRPFSNLMNRIDRMSVGMPIIELMDILMHDEEENPNLFRLLVETLSAADSAASNFQVLFLFFEIHLASLLGFRPHFSRCARCDEGFLSGSSLSHSISFDPSRGGGICPACARNYGAGSVISMQAFKGMEGLLRSKVGTATNISLSDTVRSEIANTLHEYLKCHIAGMRNLKTVEVFAKLT
jgi:DNA repair protein RecO (recombination protein O)